MKTRALLLPLAVVAFAGLASCRDNRASIQLQMICAPTTDCVFSATCDMQTLGYAFVDSMGTGRLRVFVQVENQLADNSDKNTGRLNTNDAHVDQMVVEYDGIPLPKSTIDLPNQLVPAAGTAVIGVEAIQGGGTVPSTLRTFAPSTTPKTAVANVRLRGYLDDNSRWETGDFPVTFRVCTGCLPYPACPAQQACPGIEYMEPVACGTTK